MYVKLWSFCGSYTVFQTGMDFFLPYSSTKFIRTREWKTGKEGMETGQLNTTGTNLKNVKKRQLLPLNLFFPVLEKDTQFLLLRCQKPISHVWISQLAGSHKWMLTCASMFTIHYWLGTTSSQSRQSHSQTSLSLTNVVDKTWHHT